MATDFIPVDQNARLGQRVRSAVDLYRTAKAEFANLKAIMEAQTDYSSGTANFAEIAAQFGVAVGDAEALYNLVSGVVAKLAENEAGQIDKRLG